jgi:hypothetical protein
MRAYRPRSILAYSRLKPPPLEGWGCKPGGLQATNILPALPVWPTGASIPL